MPDQSELSAFVSNAADRKRASLKKMLDAAKRTFNAKIAVRNAEAEAAHFDDYVNMKPNNETTRAAWIREHFPEATKELDDALLAEQQARYEEDLANLELTEASLQVRIYTVYQPIVINQ